MTAGAIQRNTTLQEISNPLVPSKTSGNIQPLGTFSNPYLYKTYYYDIETGLYYLNVRYYDAKIGRFLSRDPKLGLDNNRLGKNEYIYCENDPVSSSDPDGKRTKYNYKGYSLSYAKQRTAQWNKKYKEAYKHRNDSSAAWNKFVKIRGTWEFWCDQVYGAQAAIKKGKHKNANSGRNKSRTKAEKQKDRAKGKKDVKKVDKKYVHKKGWAPKKAKQNDKKNNRQNKNKPQVKVKTYVDLPPDFKVTKNDTITLNGDKNKADSKPGPKFIQINKDTISAIDTRGNKLSYHKGSGYPVDFSYQYSSSNKKLKTTTQYRVQASMRTIAFAYDVAVTLVAIYYIYVGWWSPIPDPV